ncbi:VOC family protein [Paenibacillus sp. PAMC21692]|uniref:VOC family protein n=1 Tax=Paenibacillus sp. PAMC21692 TaxID=2762320 RepID=UPI00164D221B|nr:VOC family protein [Paenibacillus sp. PAMC21692]QNK58989.1 VOC family protein [Paenibacillus sp. PAMC21692]
MPHKLHPGISLGEVKLRVSDLSRSLAFYEEVIGLKLLRKQDERTAELTVDGKTTLLVLQEVPGAVVTPERSHSGLYHFAILLPTRKDLGVTLRHLVDKGVAIGQADHLVSEALYLSDPDQNGIEIYRDRPRSEWNLNSDGTVRMASDPIDWHGLLAEAENEKWRGLPLGTTMGHVHFHVGDMAKARGFYCDVLGFDIVADWMRMGALFISAGGYHHHVGLNLWAGVGAPPVSGNGTGIDYFTIILPDEEELKKLTSSITEAGYSCEERQDAVYLRDPFGIGVRLLVSRS